MQAVVKEAEAASCARSILTSSSATCWRMNPAGGSRPSYHRSPHACWVSLTVLLETEWVLRGAAGLPKRRVHDLLLAFAGLPTVSVEQPAVARKALELSGAGMDFADAIHACVADAAGCDTFVTFDRRFVGAARKAGLGFVHAP